MRRLILLALALAGCAQMGFPPGGPEDKTPPKLVSVRPESGAVNVRDKALELQFDEVVNERPSAGGAADLNQLVLISPSDGEPRVSWHRSRIEVRNRHGWRPNTTYSVTVLPGLADLHGNARTERNVIVFSTGPALAQGRVAGAIFDWAAGAPLRGGTVQALARPDTNVEYLTRADSSGRWTIANVPAGTYTVRGFNDANNNRLIDPREPWDSAHVVLTDTAHVDLYAFIHDTIGPSIARVDVRDSVTLIVGFDRPLAPAQPLDTTLLRLVAADSTVVPIAKVLNTTVAERARADSIHRADSLAAIARRDTTRGARGRVLRDTSRLRPPPSVSRDTTHREAAPTLGRPVPASEVQVTVGRPLAPGGTYRVTARDATGLLGAKRTSTRVFTTPKPGAADTTGHPRQARPPAAPPSARPPAAPPPPPPPP